MVPSLPSSPVPAILLQNQPARLAWFRHSPQMFGTGWPPHLVRCTLSEMKGKA